MVEVRGGSDVVEVGDAGELDMANARKGLKMVQKAWRKAKGRDGGRRWQEGSASLMSSGGAEV